MVWIFFESRRLVCTHRSCIIITASTMLAHVECRASPSKPWQCGAPPPPPPAISAAQKVAFAYVNCGSGRCTGRTGGHNAKRARTVIHQYHHHHHRTGRHLHERNNLPLTPMAQPKVNNACRIPDPEPKTGALYLNPNKGASAGARADVSIGALI